MAKRLYFVPRIQIATGPRVGEWGPKYIIGQAPFAATRWPRSDPGDMLVLADTDDIQHGQLTGQSDVTYVTLWENLDVAIGSGAITTVQSELEALNLPGNWVQETHTWRQMLRVVCGICSITQGMRKFIATRLFTGGVTLNTQFNDLPIGVQNAMRLAAQRYRIRTAEFSGTSTLREILRKIGQKLAKRPMSFGLDVL